MTEEVIHDEFPLEEDIKSAVDFCVDDMSLDRLRKYVNWNMKDYYINVADGEEAQDFIDTNRDTSVCIEDWEEHILYRCP